MARVTFVKKARKDNKAAGIKKGESYYWWQFAFSPKSYSKTPPTRSQLTRSSFLSTLWAIEDGLCKRFEGIVTSDDFENGIEELVGEIEELKDECQNSLDNMPYQLQESDSGQLLQERIDGLDSWISDLQSIDTETNENLTDDEKKERAEEIIQEICDTSSGL
jgi:hypothetical protein